MCSRSRGERTGFAGKQSSSPPPRLLRLVPATCLHQAFGLARLLFGRPTPRYLPKGCARLGHGEASGVSAIEGLYEPCRSPSEVTCSPGGSEFGAGPAEGFGESPGAELSGGSLRTPRERNGPGPRSSTRPRGPGGAEHADNEVEGEETSPDGLERLSRKVNEVYLNNTVYQISMDLRKAWYLNVTFFLL